MTPKKISLAEKIPPELHSNEFWIFFIYGKLFADLIKSDVVLFEWKIVFFSKIPDFFFISDPTFFCVSQSVDL